MKMPASLLCAVACLPQIAVAGPISGPGIDWVDEVQPGLFEENSALLTMFVDVSENFPSLGNATVKGPISIWNSAPYPTPAPDDDPDRMQVDLEIVSMHLIGNMVSFGQVLRPLQVIAGDGIANGVADGPLFSGGLLIEDAADNSLGSVSLAVWAQLVITAFGNDYYSTFQGSAISLSGVYDRYPRQLDLSGTYPFGPSHGPVYFELPPPLSAHAHIINAQLVPEPSSFAMLACGAVATVGLWLRWRQGR